MLLCQQEVIHESVSVNRSVFLSLKRWWLVLKYIFSYIHGWNDSNGSNPSMVFSLPNSIGRYNVVSFLLLSNVQFIIDKLLFLWESLTFECKSFYFWIEFVQRLLQEKRCGNEIIRLKIVKRFVFLATLLLFCHSVASDECIFFSIYSIMKLLVPSFWL